MKAKRRLRRVFNSYNIAIFVCLIAILGSIYIILRPIQNNDNNNDDSYATKDSKEIEIIEPETKESDEISEEDAKKAAVKQFAKLGEKTKAEDLKCIKIRRKDVEYYYVVSAENTLEISIIGGKIERINTVLVEE